MIRRYIKDSFSIGFFGANVLECCTQVKIIIRKRTNSSLDIIKAIYILKCYAAVKTKPLTTSNPGNSPVWKSYTLQYKTEYKDNITFNLQIGSHIGKMYILSNSIAVQNGVQSKEF